jgi:hypothetical protein
MRKDVTGGYRATSAVRCSLPQSEMRAVFVVVEDVFGKYPLQMAFIDGNDVIQQVTAATADPAFRDAILPGAFEGSLHRIYLQGSNRCRDFQSVLGIPIEDEKPRSRIKRKRLSQLLDDPQARGMLGDVEV